MTSGTPYIGSKISLISKAEIRYEGILYQVDTKEATVTLAKVRSFGTEDRPAPKHIPPRNETYEFIIFRGSDIKDLHVSGMFAKQEDTPSDPAILSVSSQTAPLPPSPSSYPIHQQPQPHPQGATPRMPKGPSYNPFAAAPGMGAYSPFGMPYFRPPMMMGGGTPPHPSQLLPTQGHQQQPVVQAQVPQQTQPQAFLQLQQSHPLTAIPTLGTTQTPLPPSAQSIQSITPPRPAANAPPTSTPTTSAANVDSKLQPQARSTPQQPVIEPPAAISAASGPKKERTLKSSESPIFAPSVKPPPAGHPAQSQSHTQPQPQVDPQPPPSSSAVPATTPVTPARREGRNSPPPEPPRQEKRAAPASATAVEPSPSSQGSGAPTDRRRQPNSYYTGGSRGRGGYRGRRDNHYRGPPRGGGPPPTSSQNPVYRYDSEFDFESANARFNKDDLEEEFKQKLKVDKSAEGEEKVSNGSEIAAVPDEVSVEEIPADEGDEEEFYDKSKSFFDSISCESKAGGTGRRPHWSEEREMNTETFGVSSVQGYRRGGRGRGRGRGGRRGNSAEAKKQGPARSSSPTGSSLFGTLVKRASSAGEYRECSDSGCKRLASMQRALLNCPDVVCIGLIWDSDQPSVDYIKGIIDSIGLSIKLTDVFDQVANPQTIVNEYQLTGIVAYYGRHYSTFSYHSALKEWVYFDDAKFRKIGPQWSTVVQQCYKAHYQPLLLVYDNPKAQNINLSKAPLETKMISCDCRGGGRGTTAPLSTLQEEEEESENEASTPTNQIVAPLTTLAGVGTTLNVNQVTTQISAPSSASNHITEMGFPFGQPLQTNARSLPNQLTATQQQSDISRDLMEFSINPVGASMTTPTATPLSTAVRKDRPPHEHFDPLTHPPLPRSAPPSTAQSSATTRPRAQVTAKSDALGGDDLMMFSISPMQVSAIGNKYAEAPPTTLPSTGTGTGTGTGTTKSNTIGSQGFIHPLSSTSPSPYWSRPPSTAPNQPQPGIRYQPFPPPSVTNSKVPPVGYRPEVSPPPGTTPNGIRYPPPATGSGVPPAIYRPGLPAAAASNVRSSAMTVPPPQQNVAAIPPQAAAIGFEGFLRLSVASPTQGGVAPSRATPGYQSRATPGYQSGMHGSSTSKLQSGHPGPVVQHAYPTASSQLPLRTSPTQQARWEHFEAPDTVRTRPVPVSGNQPQSLPHVHIPRPIPSSTTPSLSTQFAPAVPPTSQTPPTSHAPPTVNDPFYATPDEPKKTETKRNTTLPTSSAPVPGFSKQGLVPEAQSTGLTPPIGIDPLYAVPTQILQRQARGKAVGQPNGGTASSQVHAASTTASVNMATSNKSTQTLPPIGNDPKYAVPDKPHQAPPREGPAEVPIGSTQHRDNTINPAKVDTVKPSDAAISFGAHSTPPIGNDPLYAVPIKPNKQDSQAPANLAASSLQPVSPAAKTPVSTRDKISPPIGRDPTSVSTQSRAVNRTEVSASDLRSARTQKTSSLPRSGVRLQPSSDVLVRTTSVGGRLSPSAHPSGRDTGYGKTGATAAPGFQTLPAGTRSTLVETMNVWARAEASAGTDKALALVLFTQAIGLLQKVLQDPTVRATPALLQQVYTRKELGVAKCRELRAQLEPPRPRRSEGKNCVKCGQMRTSLNEQSMCGPCQLKMKMGRT